MSAQEHAADTGAGPSFSDALDSIDWIEREWNGLLPGREGFCGDLAQLTRIGHGLTGIENVLDADRDLRDEEGYTPLDVQVEEDLRIARRALTEAMRETLDSMKQHLRDHPIATIREKARAA